jgi:cell division protein FtsL
MEKKPKIDLQQHTMKRVSKKYLLKILLYLLLLIGAVLLVFNFKQSKQLGKKKDANKDVREIKNITIEK